MEDRTHDEVIFELHKELKRLQKEIDESESFLDNYTLTTWGQLTNTIEDDVNAKRYIDLKIEAQAKIKQIIESL